MSFLKKLLDKPSDLKIRMFRVLFALLLIFLIVFGWEVTRMEWGLPEYMKYGLYFFPAVGLIRGIFDPGIFRRKIWKRVMIGIGIAMLVISLFFIEDKEKTQSENTAASIDVTEISNKKPTTSFSVSTDNWFGVLGFLLILFSLVLNNKNITRKNERYGEKVTKIRV